MVMYLRINFCVIPENIHAQPKDSHWKFQGRGAPNPKTSLEKGGGEGLWVFSGTTRSKKSLT